MMTSLVGTFSRRLAWAALAASMAVVVVLFILSRTSFEGGASPGNDDVWSRLLILPLLVGAITLLVASILAKPPSLQAAPMNTEALPVAQPLEPLRAQVVGLYWLNPLQPRDYPTQWQLLRTLGLATMNANDDRIAADSQRYAKPEPIAPVVSASGAPLHVFFSRYLDKLFDLMHDAYFNSATAFHGAKKQDRPSRRTLADVFVVCALPSTLDADVAARILRDRLSATFDPGDLVSNEPGTEAALPDIKIVSGNASAGFAALSTVLDDLDVHPDRTAWLIGWDAPDAEQTPQSNENLVLMVLAGPEAITGREPLAWLGRPASEQVSSFTTDPQTPRVVRAWTAAIEQACRNADVRMDDLAYAVHDAGPSSDHLGRLAQTLSTRLPEFDFQKQTFNSASFFGDCGACTSLTDIALAVGHVAHFGHPALVACTTLPEQPAAMVVAQARRVAPFTPDGPWFRANSEAHAYLPWWALRHDAPTYPQGYSE